MRIIVVGGVAGGATAVARLRRLDENAEIILIERGSHVSFANCGLPYYIGGTIARREALFVSSKETIESRYNIDIRLNQEVVDIDPTNKEITVHRQEDDTNYQLKYDKLLLSTGSSPFVPDPSVLELPNVFKLWNIPDVDAISDYIAETNPKKAVVVGGGFIGLEMVENLADKNMEVTLIEMADQVMPPFDPDMAKIIANHLVDKNVRLMLSTGFEGFEDDGKAVITSNGEKIETDLTIISIGVRPNNELAQKAGLELNKRGGIVVDKYLQTSDPHIYAVGDVIEINDKVLGQKTMIPLAGPANKQGRAVAANILGKDPEIYEGSIGTSIAKVFDITAASVGTCEKILKRENFKYKEDYFVAVLHPANHAGYYPGSTPMTIKLIFAKDGKVLGAQIVGRDGVDKRIDTIATLMHFGGTVSDLTDLELAYAPPYSSAKDPVNFAGYIAQNILQGLTDSVTYLEYKQNQEKYTLLDIRENAETMAFKVDDAIHIPLSEIRNRLDELDNNKHYLTFCAVGLRGYVAERVLTQNNFKVSNLLGGAKTMQELDASLTITSKNTNNQIPIGTNSINSNPETTSLNPENVKIEILDVCGLSCPGPIVEVAKAIEEINDGDVIEITATDPGFTKDIESWAKNTNNTLLEKSEENGKYFAKVQKGLGYSTSDDNQVAKADQNNQTLAQKEKTMIIFDGDLDKAIASFIIATGAAAMGNKVHMFFTFWGLSILRKPDSPKVKKDFMGKMFGMMLPKGSKKLGLSKMNFGGAGAKMIRSVMDKKGINSLEELIAEAIEMGVELTACQMTMDIMGLKKEELIDGVQIGGVATMLNDSDNSNMNLFIS
ncbi:MAG: FAD-dependent oxidoreductase [Clostridiaceae bacterium]|nr:FAD-dependent oxidoreductase [Clostridiaceae bacterium]